MPDDDRHQDDAQGTRHQEAAVEVGVGVEAEVQEAKCCQTCAASGRAVRQKPRVLDRAVDDHGHDGADGGDEAHEADGDHHDVVLGLPAQHARVSEHGLGRVRVPVADQRQRHGCRHGDEERREKAASGVRELNADVHVPRQEPPLHAQNGEQEDGQDGRHRLAEEEHGRGLGPEEARELEHLQVEAQQLQRSEDAAQRLEPLKGQGAEGAHCLH
mmetsp:Transcript_18055/g.63439  ORF Transcript_18055/g.63439 Transcript_18055/m.63439 type:complete len:215 (+) Transcript_18055:1425-2069(+)